MNNLEQLFYSANIQADTVILEDQEAVHCTLVLRKKVGDIIHVVNGKGNLYTCGIDSLAKREVSCTILNTSEREKSSKLSLAIAPTKNRDRLEWLIEKVVELGVSTVYFISTDRTERSKINMDRILKKAIGAMKQSLRYYLPEFKEVSYHELLQLDYQEKFIAHCIAGYQMQSINVLSVSENLLVLIGPEGDFTADEVQQALDKGFSSLGLGKYRLRTETAAIAVAVMANSQIS